MINMSEFTDESLNNIIYLDILDAKTNGDGDFKGRKLSFNIVLV